MPEPERIRELFILLLQSPIQNFPTRGKLTENEVSCEKGVYIIYNPAGVVSHVGNTPRGREGICQRLNNHLQGSSSFSKKFLAQNHISLRNGHSFRYLIVDSARDRVLLEALAIGGLCPEHIGTHENVLQ